MSIWKIDEAHASATFKVQHRGFAWVIGQIYGVNGEIEFDPANVEQAQFNGSLDVSTLSTGVKMRDGHLLSADFFDAENHPTINFHSHGVKKVSDSEAVVSGHLEIRGKAQEVELQVQFHGTTTKTNDDGSTDEIAAFTLSTNVDRRDFGLIWNVDLPGGKVLVGNEVEINVELEAIKQK